MNKNIDRDKVYWMLRTGFHPAAIARRLGCSRRQVDRIKKAEGWSGSYKLTSFAEIDEYELWRYYREMGESYQRIGQRFGVTRQMVHKKLTQNELFLDLGDYGPDVMKKIAELIKEKTYVFWVMQDKDLIKKAGYNDYDAFIDGQLGEFSDLANMAKAQIRAAIKIRNKEINNNLLHPIQLYDKTKTSKN